MALIASSSMLTVEKLFLFGTTVLYAQHSRIHGIVMLAPRVNWSGVFVASLTRKCKSKAMIMTPLPLCCNQAPITQLASAIRHAT